ncbi:MAG: scyllo-inositol 2-dehydrogenase (NAD(+)) [Methanobacteriota archaeon]|mgnify:CR=1 FL=1|nr:hypothetical protein [Euryarchaeota archaeon]CAI8176820.1 MAG: scyllo-inositol 2-dehydrogenase (NAD(+)) [Euryarchaeota archaeon]|tara:strand:+ start:2344 stop:3357 length:1014 start_codon:yes stop_codon:yes gene_type:complete
MTGVAVIGTGYWGRNHVRTFCALRDEGLIEEVVICDSDEGRAANIASEFGCQYVTDAALLSSLNVSMVTIATPTPSHAELAISMMHEGLDVLVEKPLAMNIKEAVKIKTVAEETGRLLLVGHVFRHHAGVRKAAEMIRDGKLGPVRHIVSERLAVREPREDIGVIAALGIHDLDICTDILGGIRPVTMQGMASESEIKGIEDHADLLLEFPAGLNGEVGAMASIHLSWRSRIRGKVRSLEVVGRDGSLYVDYMDHSGIWFYSHPGNAHGAEFGGFGSAPRERIEIAISEPALTAELRDFILRSKGERNGITLNGVDVGIEGMRLVEDALRVTGFLLD